MSYSYDAEGENTGMTDASGTSSYAYDPFGELTSMTSGAGNTVGYTYNSDGEPTGVTYPLPSTATWATSDTISYSYDHAGYPASITDFNGHEISISRTADGLPSSMALGSTGDTISATYDPADQPSAISLKNSSTTLQSFTYADAQARNILTETDTPTSSQSPAAYTYNSQGSVMSMRPGTGSALDYTFDASGNLDTLPTGAATSYDNAGELTSSALGSATTSYAYNADGQRVSAEQGSATVASGTWNGAGELGSYDDPGANMATAVYDGNGLRASATVGATSQTFTWNAASQGPQLLMDSQNAYIYGYHLGPIEQVNLSSGAVSYLTSDALGSIRGTVNSSGALTATTAYDAWGNPEAAGGLTAQTPFGYAGGYTDPTGLIYLVNRYYDPASGQFLSVDPDVSSTLQPYSYGQDDPVQFTDPLGLAPESGAAAADKPYKPGNKFYILGAWNDSDGRYIPLRHGFANDEGDHPRGFGYTHYASKHNLTGHGVIREAIEKGDRVKYKDDEYSGWPVWDYEIVVQSEIWEAMDVTYLENVLVGTSEDPNFWGRRLEDGHRLGVLTAFCPLASEHNTCPPFVSGYQNDEFGWAFYEKGQTKNPGAQM